MPTKTKDKARDNQRQRVYDAERLAFPNDRFDSDKLKDLSVEDCQKIVNKITHSNWWTNRYGGMMKAPSNVEVCAGQGFKNAVAYTETNTIYLPLWARKMSVILHELAHIAIEDRRAFSYYILYDPPPIAAHGPEFAKEFLALVQRWMGKEEAKALREGYKAKRVKYRVKED